MTTLALTLLGRPQISVDGQPVELKSQKAQALFFYLAMTRQNHSRQSLAGLLWSDMEENAARRNLRVELLKLRGAVEPFVEGSRETIGLDRTSNYSLDVAQFERCLVGHEPTFAELQEAVALDQGDFLEDFHVRDAPLFEEWVTGERERLQQMARQARLRLVEHYIVHREYDRALECVNQLLKREPWLEEAHQQMMRLLALNGQRSAALAHYELASQVLNNEFGVPPSDETNALYDQIESGAFEGESSPLVPRGTPPRTDTIPRTPPFQAPATQLHFVGRYTELEALQQQVAAPNRAPLVAVVGMGGVGKTTLVAQLAHTLRDHFADGVLWAYTADSEPIDILGSWSQALGYDFSGLSDVENRAAALRGVVSDKTLLFLLDDVRSVARVRPLLVGGPASVTLLTTRDADVAFAFNAQIYPLTEMSEQDGEALLIRILGEARVHPELAAARQICALLQNLPLAVEIAAQRLRSRPRRRLADMAARLHDTEARLDLAISDRAVRTSFLVSWGSLDGEQRRIFALLGLFGGRSFAAPALAYIADLDLYTAEDRLFTLTALSLLTEEAETTETALRYRQHPLLADFAQEQLGDNHAGLLRLAQYYLHFAESERANYAALQPEWENLVAGLQAAHALTEWQLVLDYTDALTEPWFTRARYSEARQAYALAQAAAAALGDEETLAECLLRWGRACIEQYDFDEAEELLTQCVEIFAQVASAVGIATVKYHLARIAVELANYASAEQLLQESLAYWNTQNDFANASITLYQQALLAYRRGSYEQAQSLCQQSLSIQQDVSATHNVLPTLRLLADIALEQHDYSAAESHCQEALAICNELDNSAELAYIYYSLAVASRLKKNLRTAQSYAQNSIELCKRSGNRGCQAAALYELSRVNAENNDFPAAVALGEQSTALMQELRDTFNLVNVLRHLGEIHFTTGHSAEARVLWQQAHALAQANNHPLSAQIEQKLYALI
jgi:DNA-binding SARP family transcriptional activator/predicted ATPase